MEILKFNIHFKTLMVSLKSRISYDMLYNFFKIIHLYILSSIILLKWRSCDDAIDDVNNEK